MGASLLTDEEIVLNNVPDSADVKTMIEILESAGKEIDRHDDHTIRGTGRINSDIPYEPVRKMRLLLMYMGP